MSEYQHEDRKEYLIAEGPEYRIWNNGVVEYKNYSNYWGGVNLYQTLEERLEFLKCWENAKIGKNYSFDLEGTIIQSNDGSVTFLGLQKNFKLEKKMDNRINIKPFNSRLLIEIIEEKEQKEGSLYIPKEIKERKNLDKFLRAKVLDISDNLKKDFIDLLYKEIYIETGFLEEIRIDNKIHRFTTINYVVCVVQ